MSWFLTSGCRDLGSEVVKCRLPRTGRESMLAEEASEDGTGAGV
jgi:hypothetical protein